MEAKNSDMLFPALEEARSKKPVVFNIETTNICPLKCKFCPRTTQMIRSLHTMSLNTFERIAEELKPHSTMLWRKWKRFIRQTYKVTESSKRAMGENHFYLFISSKCITLHGYGEPVFDKTLAEKIQMLSDKNIPSYFSMNPANINMKQLEEIFEAGLDYLKFSVDSVYDMTIRGDKSKFFPEGIYKVLDRKNECGFETKIILTMLDLPDSKPEHAKFMKLYKDKADYIYIKSRDNRWLDNEEKLEQKSLHWTMPCLMPWSSLSVLSRGYVVPCHQIYNAELVLGDIKYESLSAVWNGEGYRRFRKAHFDLNKNIIGKCINRCDMQLVGNL